MSIKDCIDVAVQNGEMSFDEGVNLKNRYDKLEETLQAKGAARDALMGELTAEGRQRRRATKLQERARQTLEKRLLGHFNARGQQDPGAGLMFTFENFNEALFPSVEGRKKALLMRWQAPLAEFTHEFAESARFTGEFHRRFGDTKQNLEDLIDELHGADTGNQMARGFAVTVTQTIEDGRQLFNAAGGNIPKMDDYGLPQKHNRDAIRAMQQEPWVEFIFPLLDRTKMVDSSGTAFTDQELRDVLGGAWESIVSEGWSNKRTPSYRGQGKGALFKQRMDHRFLKFKDGPSYRKYMEQLGDVDAYSALTGHFASMARDIAFMQIMGPNPHSMVNYLKGFVEKWGQTAPGKAIKRTETIARASKAIAGTGMAPKLKRILKMSDDMNKIQKELRSRQGGYTKAGWFTKGDDIRVPELKAEVAQLKADIDLAVMDLDSQVKGAKLAKSAETDVRELMDGAAEERPTPAGGVFLNKNDPATYARTFEATSQNMFDHMRGTANTPVNTRLAEVSSGIRNVEVASKLGQAAWSALTDPVFGHNARKMAGLSNDSFIKDTVGNMVRFAKHDNMKHARLSGMMSNKFLHSIDQLSRLSVAGHTQKSTGMMAERVVGWSYLNGITQTGKDTAGMGFTNEILAGMKKPFEDLNPAWQFTLNQNGITAKDWSNLSGLKPHLVDGMPVLRPQDVEAQAGLELTLKYLNLIDSFTKIAVPEPGVRTTALMTQGLRPGTGGGEMLRFAFQFKSFAISVMLMHAMSGAREIIRAGSGGSKGAMLSGGSRVANMVIGLTILGGIVSQMKEINSGRDPRDMTDEKFWKAAAMQGGGMGIIGDFAFSNTNRYGKGLADTLVGPAMGSIFDPARKLVLGAADDENPSGAMDLTRFIQSNLPGGNLWFWKLPLDRLVFDKIEEMAHPKGSKSFKKSMGRRKTKHGQEYWWGEGEAGPGRLPDLSAALGE